MILRKEVRGNKYVFVALFHVRVDQASVPTTLPTTF